MLSSLGSFVSHAPQHGVSHRLLVHKTLGCAVSFTFRAQLCSSCTAQLAVRGLNVESSDVGSATLSEMWSKGFFKNYQFLQFLSSIYIFVVVQIIHSLE